MEGLAATVLATPGQAVGLVVAVVMLLQAAELEPLDREVTAVMVQI